MELVLIDIPSRTHQGSALHLTVSEDDLGRVIGPQGRIARFLRTLVRAMGITEGFSYTLHIAGA